MPPSPVSCTWRLSQNIQSLWSLHFQFPVTAFCYTLPCQVTTSSLRSDQNPYLMTSSLALFPPVPYLFIRLNKQGSSLLFIQGCRSWTGYWQCLMAPFFISPMQRHKSFSHRLLWILGHCKPKGAKKEKDCLLRMEFVASQMCRVPWNKQNSQAVCGEIAQIVT